MSLAPPEFMPSGWPVVERGLMMGYVGAVLVVRIGAVLPKEGFDRYIDEWTRSVDARPRDCAVFALYDVPVWPGMTPVQRKHWSMMLKSREDVLRRTTRGMVMASTSPIARGCARALFWLAPPPYPTAVVDTPRAAFAHLAPLGGPWAEGALAAFDGLVARYARATERGPSIPPERSARRT